MNKIINLFYIIILFGCLSCQEIKNEHTFNNFRILIKEDNQNIEHSLKALNYIFDDCDVTRKDKTVLAKYNNFKDSIFVPRRALVSKFIETGVIDKVLFSKYQNNITSTIINYPNSDFANRTDSLVNLLLLLENEKQIIRNFAMNFGCSNCLFGIDIRILSNNDTLTLSDTLRIVLIPGVIQEKDIKYTIESMTMRYKDKTISPIQIYTIEREKILFYKPIERGIYTFAGTVKTSGITGDVFEQSFKKSFVIK